MSVTTTPLPPGVRIADMPDLGPITDSSSVVGEHAGSGRFSATNLRAYVGDTLVSAKRYGVVGDGVADDTAALQTAINAVQATGGVLFVPAGTYKVTAPLVVSKAIQIMGTGIAGQSHYLAATGYTTTTFVCGIANDCFHILTNDAVYFHDFQITYPAKPNTGVAGITLDTDGTLTVGLACNFYSMFRYIHILGADIGFLVRNGISYTMEACVFQGFYHNGVVANCFNSPGNGDNTITGCTFSGATTVGGHLLITNAGGMRVINNKMNGDVAYAVGVQSSGTTATATPTLISNNSIEGVQAGECILFQRLAGATCVLSMVVITGNELTGGRIGIDIQVAQSGTLRWVLGALISGNIFQTNYNFPPPYCISVDGTTDGNIVGNLLRSNGAGVTGINIGATTTNVIQSGNVKGAGVT